MIRNHLQAEQVHAKNTHQRTEEASRVSLFNSHWVILILIILILQVLFFFFNLSGPSKRFNSLDNGKQRSMAWALGWYCCWDGYANSVTNFIIKLFFLYTESQSWFMLDTLPLLSKVRVYCTCLLKIESEIHKIVKYNLWK